MKLFNIETIKDLNNNEVSFCPGRGGIITSLKFQGKEILYFDKDTFINKKMSVRGGIPILFPNAGELEDNKLFPKLKRHGFARDLEWDYLKKSDSFIEKLSSSELTKDLYSYNFRLSVSGNFEKDNSFSLVQEVISLEEDKEMPVSMGLHPYFKVKNEDKVNIKFNFFGGNEIEEKFDIWGNGGTVVVDNPKIKHPDSLIEIIIPDLGKIVLDMSVEYQKIWVWSQPGKDFICIEPMMRGENGLINNPALVENNSSIKAYLKINLI